jgi:hypothetical protein
MARRSVRDHDELTAAQHPAAPIARMAPRATAWSALLLAAFLVGTALRVWQLDIQILIDDEWHAIHKLLRASPVDILTHLGYADYSIPLTLYLPAGCNGRSGCPSGACTCRRSSPAWACCWSVRGCWRDLFALPVRATWTMLIAISPLLVYHSKIARPYALTSLLTFVAILAFRAWWLGRRRRDAGLYVAATFFAGWLHAITLPFTLLPFAYCGLRALRPLDAGRVAAIAKLAAATALALALALAPPMIIDWAEFSGRAGRSAVSLESLYRTLLMLAGTGAGAVGMFVFALRRARLVARVAPRTGSRVVSRDDLRWRSRRRRVERRRVDRPSARARALPDTGRSVRAAVRRGGHRRARGNGRGTGWARSRPVRSPPRCC